VTAEFPHASHELALLHERGIDNVLFVDFEYSIELLAQATELGYAPSAYWLGECYEWDVHRTLHSLYIIMCVFAMIPSKIHSIDLPL